MSPAWTMPRGASVARARAWLVESGPVLAAVCALAVKLLYFVRVVYPLPRGWSHPRAWLVGVALATLGSLGTLLVVTSPLFLLRAKARYVAAWCIDLLGTTLIIADVLYLRFYSDILSVSAMADVGQVGMISETVLSLLRPTDALFLGDLVIGAVAFAWYSRRVGAGSLALRRQPWWTAAGLLVGASLTIIPLHEVLSGGPLSFMAHLKVRGAGRIGLFNYHAYDVVRQRYFDRANHAATHADSARVRALLARSRASGPAPSPMFGVARDKNLILLMVESLEGFVVGLRTDGGEVTPNLNALASRSIVFENFYSQAWHGATSDGEFTSLQSLHPLADGAVPTLLTRQRFRALPHVLAEHGYRTISAHGAPGAMWSVRTMHRRYGFQKSYFLEDLIASERLGMGLSDGAFFRQAAPLIAHQREPFAAYLITLSTHHPYAVPKGHARLNVGALEGSRLGGYLQSVHYFDEVFGEFLRGLDSAGVLDRSVLALYGDHPANSGPGRDLQALLARYGGYVRPASGPDFRLWQAEHRLAFVIHLPGDARAGRRVVAGGQLDIAPTLLDLLGVDDPRMAMLGRDLFLSPSSAVVFRDGSFVVGDTLCVAAGSESVERWCRDVRTGDEIPVENEAANFTAARERLALSDMILAEDLIFLASGVQDGHHHK